MNEPQPAAITLCNRRTPDRRICATPLLSRYLRNGRRVRNRRLTDPQQGYYVDCVQGPFAWALVLLAALISFDTSSTLFIISQGGRELNPIMSWVYGFGSTWFVLTKLLPLLVMIPLLALHRFFPIGLIGVRLLLYPYAFVSVIHIVVLAHIYS
jgi:hypothetical protein